jgi:hypothetical protein
MNRTFFRQLKEIMEYLGGEREQPPTGFWLKLNSPLWGIWWGILIGLIVIFCGQSSKFIYIDF